MTSNEQKSLLRISTTSRGSEAAAILVKPTMSLAKMKMLSNSSATWMFCFICATTASGSIRYRNSSVFCVSCLSRCSSTNLRRAYSSEIRRADRLSTFETRRNARKYTNDVESNASQ